MFLEAIELERELGLGWNDCGKEPLVLFAEVSFGEVDESNTALTVKITNPLAFVCHGSAVPAETISPSEHPLVWNALPTSVDWITKYLDADYIQGNMDRFKEYLVGHDSRPKRPDYLAQFK